MLMIPLTMTTRTIILANDCATAAATAQPTTSGTNTVWWCDSTMSTGSVLGIIVTMTSIILTSDVVVDIKLVVMMTMISMKYCFTITTDKTTMWI